METRGTKNKKKTAAEMYDKKLGTVEREKKTRKKK
jgi:hypothetical protein